MLTSRNFETFEDLARRPSTSRAAKPFSFFFLSLSILPSAAPKDAFPVSPFSWEPESRSPPPLRHALKLSADDRLRMKEGVGI